MKNMLMLFVLILLSCNNKKENLTRRNECINIIQTLIGPNGLEMEKNFSTKYEIPICLNLKKNIVNNKCFVETKSDNKIKIVKLPEKSFTSNGEVCIEKLYKSKPINHIKKRNSTYLR